MAETTTIRSLEDIRRLRPQIMELARQYRARKVSVFGSCVRGEMHEDSDIDFLVDFEDDYRLLDIAGMMEWIRGFAWPQSGCGRPPGPAQGIAGNRISGSPSALNAEQRLYCQDILERIERIENFIAKGQEAFARSYVIRDSIILNFIETGEATKHLDEALTKQHPHINWKGIAGFRDILIQQYRRTRLELVWRTAQENLPPLKAAITSLLSSLDASETGS